MFCSQIKSKVNPKEEKVDTEESAEGALDFVEENGNDESETGKFSDLKAISDMVMMEETDTKEDAMPRSKPEFR